MFLSSAAAEVDRLNKLREWRPANVLPPAGISVLMSADPSQPTSIVFTAIRQQESWFVNQDGFMDPRDPNKLAKNGYTWCYIPGYEPKEGTPE